MWLKESNRMQHLIGVFLVSLIGTALMGIGCIGGMEFKDCHHDARNYGLPMDRWTWRCWDWLDVWAGLIGAALAVAVHVVVVLLILLNIN